MATSALAATGLASSLPTLQQHQQQLAAAATSSSSSSSNNNNIVSTVPTSKSGAPVTRLAIRDGKTIGINDYIYLSAAWAPGAGEPYIIARVMEFVTAASSRSGAAALASSSGTLQVRANVFLRMRDISLRNTNDPRLLVATMHSDVFNLENVRGVCEVRHRELIGNGSAPEVSQWKKKDDHFYYYQLYDRYIHRFYDVIPTEKVKNAPPSVLSVLRTRYSFIVAEVGMMADLCDALRGCAVCHRWAASVESVRCDTCKSFFHMKCLNPPLASKPAKGYSWTCAPCSRRHQQDVDHALATGGTVSSASSANGSQPQITARTAATSGTIGPARGRGGASGGRGRGRGGSIISTRRSLMGREEAASSSLSPDASPAPEKTQDDIRGTRCFNRWPYRYFGQHTNALDVLDPHDSVYPIATTRLGAKYQAILPTWEEQKEAGLGTHFRAKGAKEDEGGPDEGVPPPPVVKKKGRPPKRKRGVDAADRSDTPVTGSNTPVLLPAALPSEPPEFERGTDSSAELTYRPSLVPNESLLDAYISSCQNHFKAIPRHNVDLLNRALQMLVVKEGKPAVALAALSKSTPEDLRLVHWSAKEIKQFEQGIHEVNSDMKQLKKRIPTKRVSDIVRYFVVWKTQRIREDLEAQSQDQGVNTRGVNAKSNGSSSGPPRPSTSRAVSPSLSVFGDGPPAGPSTTCSLCAATSSPIWYKGPTLWSNRALCVNCGIHWRKYAAEGSNNELLSVTTRTKAAAAAAASNEDSNLGVAVPAKISRKESKAAAAAASTASGGAAAPNKAADPLKCVLCKRVEPTQKLVQCQQCSLSVHQGCFGLSDAEVGGGGWMCEPCNNENTLDAALIPHCILCSRAAQDEAAALSAKAAAPAADAPRQRGRPRIHPLKDENGMVIPKKGSVTPITAPLSALDAFKPTECNNWVHLVCAVWMPDVVFSDVERFKTVEGCGSLPSWRYEATCSICSEHSGACVVCAEPSCRKTMHVSCAFNQGYAVGFEVVPNKKRDTLTFKGEHGSMGAHVYCRDHAPARRLFDIGESEDGLTALQVYARSNKTVSESTYALLRRAKRFNAVLGGSAPRLHSPASRRQCAGCGTGFSPFWWPVVKSEEAGGAPSSVCCNACRPTLAAGIETDD